MLNTTATTTSPVHTTTVNPSPDPDTCWAVMMLLRNFALYLLYMSTKESLPQ